MSWTVFLNRRIKLSKVESHYCHEYYIPDPFEKHCIPVLTGQVNDQGWTRSPNVGPDHQWFRTLSLVLQSVRLDPDLVLRVWL